MKAVVIGVGNRLRGDDGVGLAVCDLLLEDPPSNTEVYGFEHVPAELCEHWEGASSVVLVDACVSEGSEPGAIRRLNARDTPLAADTLRLSTHGFGLAEAIELARSLDALPPRLCVYAIEGRSFERGEGLSPAVAAAAKTVAAQIRAELEASCTSAP